MCLCADERSGGNGNASPRLGYLTDARDILWLVQNEKADVAFRVLRAIAEHSLVIEQDTFQLRFWVDTEEALLPLAQIARLILLRESNSRIAQAVG